MSLMSKRASLGEWVGGDVVGSKGCKRYGWCRDRLLALCLLQAGLLTAHEITNNASKPRSTKSGKTPICANE